MKCLVLPIALAVASALTVAGANAQPREQPRAPTDAERAVAREVGYAGIEHFESEEYAAALDKLERADKLLNAPTLGLWRGRALIALGRLVEASELLYDVGRRPVPKREPWVHRKAQREAAKELDALLPRIPHLDVQLQGAVASEVDVSLDGEPLPSTMVGVRFPVDPGPHKLVAVRGEQRVERDVTLAEGSQRSAVLTLPPLAPAPPPAAPLPLPSPIPVALPATPMLLRPEEPNRAPSALWVAGWIASGLGGAGLLTGAITAGLAASERDGIAPSCRGEICDESVQSEVDQYNALRTASSAAFIVGGVIAAAGVTMLIIDTSDDASSPSASLSLRGVRFIWRY